MPFRPCNILPFGLVFLVFFYFLLPLKEKEFTEVYAFLLIPTFILSHLLVSFIAFVRKDQELNFWQFNKNLFINIFLTAVFTGVLTGGIMLAILAVDQLFDFNFKGRYYSYTFSFLSIFGSSFIFLLCCVCAFAFRLLLIYVRQLASSSVLYC